MKKLLLKLGLIKKAPPELAERTWLDWKDRFDKWQKILLWLANHWFLKWILGLNRLPEPIKKEVKRIDLITSSSIHWRTGKKFWKTIKRKKVLVEEWKMAAFTRQRFAEALQVSLFPIFILGHIWDLLFGDRFELAPSFGFSTSIYYAGGGDGFVGRDNVATWANAHDTPDGNIVNYTYDSDSNEIHSSLLSSTYYLRRHFMPVDTSGLPDNANISSASYYFYFINDGNNANNHGFRIVPTTQASVTELTIGDYDEIGTTAYSSDVLKSSLTNAQMNSIELNATGISAISKTGWTKIGMRSTLDINNTTPTGVNTLRTRNSEYTGTTYDPYLSVTYTVSLTNPAFLLNLLT
jgi:hypothetical protein